MVLRVATATHGDVDRLMRRPYHRTLWLFFQLLERERIDDIERRVRDLRLAGLLAIAFNEPKKLADEHHQIMRDAGALPTPDEAIDNVQDVIAFMAQRHKAAETAEGSNGR